MTSNLASESGSTITSQGCRRCRVRMTQRPSTTSGRYDVARSNIVLNSTSVKRRSSIRLSRWGLNSSSHSHHSGQLPFFRAYPYLITRTSQPSPLLANELWLTCGPGWRGTCACTARDSKDRQVQPHVGPPAFPNAITAPPPQEEHVPLK